MQVERITLPWRAPEAALAALCGGQAFALALIGGGSHPRSRFSYLMGDPVRVIRQTTDRTGNPLAGLGATLAEVAVVNDPDGPPFQGGWAGLLSYGLGHAFERFDRPVGSVPEHPWPDLVLGLFDTLAAFDREAGVVHVLSSGLEPATLQPDPETAGARIAALAARLGEPDGEAEAAHPQGAGALALTASPEAIARAVGRTVDYIEAGDIFQANIALTRDGALGPGDQPLDLFARLIGRHPAPFGAYLAFDDATGKRAVVSHSPECFLSLSPDGVLKTSPIKGTAPRHAEPASDAASAAGLAASAKDRAENLMIVDLMRNDLARVCMPGTVWVPRLFAPEAFTTVHHLVSEVHGQLRPGLTAFDALAAAFPPGSITGAPKVRAMQIISELEATPRGPWCGSMVWVGFDGAMESSVLIRTAACHQAGPDQPWRVEVRGGAGIVADSDPQAEVREMMLKTKALAWAVTGRDDG